MIEGKIKAIFDDKGNPISYLTPGQSGTVTGFKASPDPGFPLYKINDPFEGKYLVQLRLKRLEKQKSEEDKNILNKKVLSLDRTEKRLLYSGDRMSLMSQLDIIDENDVEKMKRQLSKEIKKADSGTTTRVYKQKRREMRIERLQNMIDKAEGKPNGSESEDTDNSDDSEKSGEETEDEKIEITDEERKQFTSLFKGHLEVHRPIILKASSSGALETLIKEVNKTIRGSDKISIMYSGVGPVSEADLSNAFTSDAAIYSFNQPLSDLMNKRSTDTGVLTKK